MENKELKSEKVKKINRKVIPSIVLKISRELIPPIVFVMIAICSIGLLIGIPLFCLEFYINSSKLPDFPILSFVVSSFTLSLLFFELCRIMLDKRIGKFFYGGEKIVGDISKTDMPDFFLFLDSYFYQYLLFYLVFTL